MCYPNFTISKFITIFIFMKFSNFFNILFKYESLCKKTIPRYYSSKDAHSLILSFINVAALFAHSFS